MSPLRTAGHSGHLVSARAAAGGFFSWEMSGFLGRNLTLVTPICALLWWEPSGEDVMLAQARCHRARAGGRSTPVDGPDRWEVAQHVGSLPLDGQLLTAPAAPSL